MGNTHWVCKQYETYPENNRPVLHSHPFYPHFPPPSHMLKGVNTWESLSPALSLTPWWWVHPAAPVGPAMTGAQCLSLCPNLCRNGVTVSRSTWRVRETECAVSRTVAGCPPAFLAVSPLFPPFLLVSLLASLFFHPQTLTTNLLCASSYFSW